ncbi:MAG: hypothetical protein QXQ81_01745 [Candidatus Thorarchaeota archaeon]
MTPDSRRVEEDPYQMDPRLILSEYTVEWTALRESYEEVKRRLAEIQGELADLDRLHNAGGISDSEYMERYRDMWHRSTELIQVKREVEARLQEIQREIRAANVKIALKEEERLRRERIEQEKANAMVEWMGLKQGFDLIIQQRDSINAEMDQLELKRRNGTLSDSEYRKQHIEHIRRLAELRSLESDVRKRLAELLEIIRG